MSAGYDHCVCIDSAGRVWSWGARGHTPRDVRPGAGDGPRGGAAEGGAAPALVAARLVGGGQLARRVDGDWRLVTYYYASRDLHVIAVRQFANYHVGRTSLGCPLELPP